MMPRTNVLKRILARAAEELGPIVEKARFAPETFTLGEMESQLQVVWRCASKASPGCTVIGSRPFHSAVPL